MMLRRNPQPSPEDQLARLADGSIAADAREELERAVSNSAQLAALLAEQQRSLALTRAIDVEAPSRLQARIAALQEGPERRRRRPRALVAVVVAVLLIVAVVLARREHAANVRGVVPIALARATLPAPASSPTPRDSLAVAVDGIAFPDWRAHGWLAAGARPATLEGHAVETVVYDSPEYSRVGYAIVAGAPLAVGSAQRTVLRGDVRYAVLRADGANVVTWLRAGHTCVLASSTTPASVLLRLASWA
jgi:hypothetical protein